VRGTTSAQIVEMAREVGANKVYFASAAPPVRYPNVYGIDMPAVTEFIANDKTIEEIGDVIGADRLFYQSLDDLIEVTSLNGDQEWDTSCFSGEYVTGDVSQSYLDGLEAARNDAAKLASSSPEETIELHNDI
jgi:amidophosphoribosyltransferase